MSSTTFSSFNENHSLAIRIWHWVTSFTIIFTIVLVLMGTYMFKTRANIPMVQEQLESKGVTVTKDQARAVAHEYSDKIWMLHKYVGYGLSFLLLCRIILEATQPGEEKFKTKIKNALTFQANTDAEKTDRTIYLLAKRGYLLFYFVFLVMVLTGLVLAFEDVEFLDPIHRLSKEIHEYSQYAVYTYILLHLFGVVWEEVGKYPGIISSMVHGKKK
ncbi:MAG TPA: cytochrome b/b6 domain-containing protein [Cyclobacteriaceae bacterium]|jgi:cytochrome b561|nr:cytochrome b/b6 domain-containing protein [Cyclobacteriaceae bacterium]